MWRRSLGVVFLLAVIVVASAFAYRLGVQRTERPTVELEEEVAQLETEKAEIAQRLEQVTAELEASHTQIASLEERYRHDVPNNAARDLLGLVVQKLEGGVDFERLAYVIDAAENPRSCDDSPVTKRFIVQTPLYKGPSGSVTFDSGKFTITGSGAVSTNNRGQVEAWYDPAQPVSIEFTHIGGKKWKETGLLPLHKTIVVGDSEYRFTVTKGPRSFVHVAADQCQYP